MPCPAMAVSAGMVPSCAGAAGCGGVAARPYSETQPNRNNTTPEASDRNLRMCTSRDFESDFESKLFSWNQGLQQIISSLVRRAGVVRVSGRMRHLQCGDLGNL